jgi:hypothetical protein
MKFAIVHLSDIHIKNAKDPVLARIDKIADAVRGVSYDIEFCVIAITGDIAYSGKEDQYVLASDAIKKLAARLPQDSNANLPVKVVVVPGNHDCDFGVAMKGRDLLLKSSDLHTDPIPDESIVKICTEVQGQFFDFRDTVCDSDTISRDCRVYYEYRFEVDGGDILFRCCNTAWMSQLHEKPGSLALPVGLLLDQDRPASVVFTLFHHPYNWLSPDNGRAFRKRVEEISDIILTGHEHDYTQRQQRSNKGESNIYIEATALQDSYSDVQSGFNLILVDAASKRQKVFNYKWSGDLYVVTTPTPQWEDYQVNKIRSNKDLEVSEDFHKHLEDPGVSLSHPTKGVLTLSDIFVYPDLLEVSYRPLEAPQIHGGDTLVQRILEENRVLITGPEKSGKTCLAKRLFSDFRKQGFVPALVDGASVLLHGDDRDYQKLAELVASQYRTHNIETIKQLDRVRRVLIVDNFHRLKTKKSTMQKIVKELTNFAGRVVVIANDVVHQINELLEAGELSEDLLVFKQYRIQQYGHVKRNELAERWFGLDPDVAADSSLFARRLIEVKRVTDTVIGRNFVPAYPVYILPLLQAQEHNQQIDLNASTYGYFYELLIRRALAQGASRETFDIKLGYLAFLAYAVFSGNIVETNESTLRRIHSAYEERYAIEVSFREMVDSLLRSQILDEINGVYCFKYSYIYYYFVASYLRDAINDPLQEEQVKSKIRDMSRHLDEENNANILLFLAHLSKHPFIVERMLESAESVFSAFPRADLELKFGSQGGSETDSIQTVYEEKPTKQSRAEYLRQLDHVDAKRESRREMQDVITEFDDAFKRYSAAFKTLQILGQMAKNFPGSMEGRQKRQIVDACYGIGLRTLGSVFKEIEANREDFVRHIEEMLREDDPRLDAEGLHRKAILSLYGMIHSISYGTIRRISNAVGSPALSQIHDFIWSGSQSAAIDLIHASIRLDQANIPFPQELVEQLNVKLKDNQVALRILRGLVVNHFHLFEGRFTLKQRICSKLGIAYKPLQRTDPRARLVSVNPKAKDEPDAE